ncbi:MAG: hypothetical protein J7619_11950 [Dyadobacter sp.]|uniref:hypothetical protein n=1 Tax=Dyadobacter sp. TaxID=1914288 RepID=UPI001B1D40D6|nr:hypothetical protein [Dyadobacter sp.]MBO9613405.1 hypothetical protein [Dyadobacter sp.]
MKKAVFILSLLSATMATSCKEKAVIVPVQRTLNGTKWKIFLFRQGDRDVHKILSFRAPNIVNISIRDDHGYLVNNVQEEWTYLYEHPDFKVFGPFDVPFSGRIIEEGLMEFQGEQFIKSK